MSKIFKMCLLLALILVTGVISAQTIYPGERVPQGALVYSLPSTVLNFTIEAKYESFIAGPYSKYAKKYLGIDAREESGNSYSLTSVEVTPFVEADKDANIALNIGSSKNASANFLELTSQGLIIWSDSYSGKMDKIRFSKMNDNAVFTKTMSTSNLTSEKTTLYKTVQSSSGYEKVAVQQSQIVEKSIEKRAEEIAALIFKLRAKRLEIITGETDATFSGEAMKSVINEINRLESDYLSLFIGKSTYGKQIVSFDVAPRADNAKQLYIAFRISETQGLLPSSNVSGRPIVLELTPDGDKISDINMDLGSSKSKVVIYRKPAIYNARLIDGQTQLLQTRVPIYQLGRLLSFPLEISVAK